MKPHPQTLKLLLLDGEPTGTWIAELDNWDVKALRIPRTRAKELAATRPELQHTGIYLLITRPDVHQDRVRVYIGESEDMAVRLRQHLDQKPDWNEVVVFTRKSNELNKAHVKYLEGLLHGKIAAANRYDLDNGNRPTMSSLHESDRYTMDELAEKIALITGALGHPMFIPLSRPRATAEPTPEAQTDVHEFLLTVPKTSLSAKLIRTDEGYVVLAGSYARADLVDSASATVRGVREKLIGEGALEERDGALAFTRDELFNSPSGASQVVMGRSSNGWEVWVDDRGQSLGQVYRGA